MPSKDEKQKHKAILNSLAAKHRADKLVNLPLPLSDLKALFDYLDEQLVEHGCDDTVLLTREFLESHQLPIFATTSWLATYGGNCDCEVLANVEEKFEDVL
ncbi:DUF2695 domain-containing protein [Hymenobacter qilianensis]|uniref:DUF2695 domain-containing protein n=1 Tax=Hymenobacter qilianensis TaxID=1385715 RepID=A0A7H0GXV4_9BACT|nr:DUF2695 domain-containing protein [Hymenobacter qilianensis]QNP53120.1 DUF2695 domain-containing protein [Hymenobacter qilianensis]